MIYVVKLQRLGSNRRTGWDNMPPSLNFGLIVRRYRIHGQTTNHERSNGVRVNKTFIGLPTHYHSVQPGKLCAGTLPHPMDRHQSRSLSVGDEIAA